MKRNLGAADELFDIPAIDYFISKNAYLGSCNNNFRYRISNTGENIKAEFWNEDVCYELAEVADEHEFELSPNGLTESIKWLFSQYK